MKNIFNVINRNNLVQPSDAAKYHIWIAIVFSGWIYFFLVLIGPFDIFPLKMSRRLGAMLPYALIFTAAYLIIIPLQKWLFKRQNKWSLVLEASSIVTIFIICLIPTFIYYKSAFILGESAFLDFSLHMYLPTTAVLIPALFFLRVLFFQSLLKRSNTFNKTMIVGNNRKDLLNVSFEDLICIRGADNYVEIYYLKDKNLQKKVMRLPLKKAHQFAPDLVKTHRSYLVNTHHFTNWNKDNSLALTCLDVPVSETYKPELLKILKFPPK
ncbi:LytTR family transcriptional regulator DNA-binding domain-containing protein [Flagellimonas flava]|uniref:LytTR family transcriptional regulator DNA-binding domain-containing protein n=1 Tax=Flagellimonas flava TaxID=570519 RepID=UPI003D66058F